MKLPGPDTSGDNPIQKMAEPIFKSGMIDIWGHEAVALPIKRCRLVRWGGLWARTPYTGMLATHPDAKILD